MTTYVIREKYFGYNDEVFYASGSRIASVFESKEQAETTYKQLEIKAARNFFYMKLNHYLMQMSHY